MTESQGGLAGYQRRHLRGLANPMKPVVRVGEAGVSEAVLKALEQALLDHELVKVRLRESAERKQVARMLAERSGAELCGVVGRTVILYRANPEDPRIELPTREA